MTDSKSYRTKIRRVFNSFLLRINDIIVPIDISIYLLIDN